MATVTQPEEIVIGFTYDVSSGCAPLTVTFTNTSQGNASNCLWDFGNGQTSNSCGTTTYTFENPGCFNISLTNSIGSGCSETLSIDSLICVLGGPTADFSSTLSTNVFYNGEVQFNNLSLNANDYTWVFGDTTSNSNEENPFHIYPVQIATSYEVMLIAADSNGCIDTVIKVITIDEDYNVYVPNTFTIDDNDVNETFIPIFSDYTQIKKYKLIIFNRWGELIWETTDYYLPWDGRANGKNCQDGVYTWKLLYEDKKYGNRTLVGHVTLLR
jgi:gliding motility-associated-like protein